MAVLRRFGYVFFFSSRAVTWSQWPRGIRRGSAAARLPRLWGRIPPVTWKSFCCECCVLSGRGLSHEPITRPEEPYRLWCVIVCDLETSSMRRPWPALGRSDTRKKNNITSSVYDCTVEDVEHSKA